jgi:hypothetical protein
MSGQGPGEQEEAFRADVARLVQATRHHLSGQPVPDEISALLGPVCHLADLLDAGASADHLREAALTVVDAYDWPNPEMASGPEEPVLDPAMLAAVERLRTAIDAMDTSEDQDWPDGGQPGPADSRSNHRPADPRLTTAPGHARWDGYNRRGTASLTPSEISASTGSRERRSSSRMRYCTASDSAATRSSRWCIRSWSTIIDGS